MARTMLIASGLPNSFYSKVVNTAYYINNRYMIRLIIDKTLYELLMGRRSNITYLSAFGRKCFVHNNNKEVLENFDAKSDDGFFLGYSPYSKA